MTKPTRKPNNGRRRRPALSMRQDTFDRLTHYVFASADGRSRTSVAETAINEYLDARGVPRNVQPPDEHERPRYVSDDTSAPALSGIMFLG